MEVCRTALTGPKESSKKHQRGKKCRKMHNSLEWFFCKDMLCVRKIRFTAIGFCFCTRKIYEQLYKVTKKKSQRKRKSSFDFLRRGSRLTNDDLSIGFIIGQLPKAMIRS